MTFGSAEEFLGLSEEEAVYVDLKLTLGDNLKKRRQRKNLTQVELAKMLKSNQSRIAKMEAGDPSVSLDLLIKSLLALGTTKQDLAGRLVSLSNNDFEDGTLKPMQHEPRRRALQCARQSTPPFRVQLSLSNSQPSAALKF